MLGSENDTKTKPDNVLAGSGGLKENKKISWVRTMIVLAVVSLVGSFLVWGSFATSANANIVNSEYQRLLGRPADSGGLAYWTSRLDKDPGQKNVMVATIMATTEYKNYQASQATSADAAWTSYINQQFDKYLRRSPTAADLSSWLSRLKSGSWTKAQFEKQLSESDEAKRKAETPAPNNPNSRSCAVDTDKPSNNAVSDPFNNWSNVHYIQHLFRTYTGRDPLDGDSGVAYWLKALDSCQKTRTEVQTAIAGSNEAKTYAARQAEIKETVIKPLKNAYMALLQSALAREGGFAARNGEVYKYDNCTAWMNTYSAGSGEMIYDFCFLGVGLNRPELDYWVHQVTVTKFVTVEEAISAINSNSPFACNSPLGSMMPSCQGGGKYASDSDTPVQSGSGSIGGGTNTGGSQTGSSPTTQSTSGSVSGTKNQSTGTKSPTKTALQTALQSAQPISEPDNKLKVCSGAPSQPDCVVVPIGTNTSVSTKTQPTQKIPELYTGDSSKCSEAQAPTLCNSYAEVWKNRNAPATIANTEDASACTDNSYKIGSNNSELCDKALGAYLSTTGYIVSEEGSTKISEDILKSSLEEFQSDHDEANSGEVVTKSVWTKLKETTGKVQQAKKAAVTDQEVVIQASNIEQRSTFAIIFPKCESKADLGSSNTGDCVKRVQQTLALISRPDLVINGKYDATTKKAVSDYQKSHNLPATGNVDSKTWKLLETAKDSPTSKSPFSPVSGSLDNKRQ